MVEYNEYIQIESLKSCLKHKKISCILQWWFENVPLFIGKNKEILSK